jgi:hypothetical protein
MDGQARSRSRRCGVIVPMYRQDKSSVYVSLYFYFCLNTFDIFL